jgi:hypothetical protein
MPTPAQDVNTFLLFAFAILLIVGAIALVAYFVLRAVLTRAADRVADQLARSIQRAGSRTIAGRQLHPAAGDPRELARLDSLSRLLDSTIRLPLVGGIGLDALLGLVPVAGDVTSAVIGAGLILRAVRLGAPRAVVSQMVANLCVDLALGAVPVVGDAADIFFRSNQKNVQLLREHLTGGKKVSGTVSSESPGNGT